MINNQIVTWTAFAILVMFSCGNVEKMCLLDLFTSADTVQDNEENINRKKVVRISIICNLEFVIDKLFVIFFLQPQELDRAVINIYVKHIAYFITHS